MRIVAIGEQAFITGFELTGVEGVETTSKEALGKLKILMDTPDMGLILVSDDIWKEVSDEMSDLRLKKPVPLIYSVPSPGSKSEKIEYRELIKRMLKIS